MIDATKGWAVGDISPAGGTIFETSDGGITWRPIARTLEVLSSVCFVTSTTGWVAGLAGRIERTDDGGHTWRTQRVERGAEVLNSVFFIDAQRGWVSGGSGLLLKTTNGGDTWDIIPTGRIEDLWTIRFVSEQLGWLVGEDGLILSTADGGATWKQQTSGTGMALLGLDFAKSNVLIATGEGGTVLRSENGIDWFRVESDTTETLNSVCASEDTIWAVGSSGAMVGSTDGGRTWKAATPVSARTLLGVDLGTPTNGVAVGRRGTVQVLRP
jgi:photosystem II stability/assembly factor-like uncharacterized protein